MAFNTGTVNVTTSATLILASNTLQKRRVIKNIGSVTVFIGSNNSVTSSTGFPLDTNNELQIGDFNGTIYGITASSSSDVIFTEDE